MRDVTNVRVLSQFDLNTGHHSVVQKGNVGSKYVYALQLRSNAQQTFVLRGYRGHNISNSILVLKDQAAGHTQTWEYAGNHTKANGELRSGQWFIGVKPNSEHWAKQIARVNIGSDAGTHVSNADFPRLAYLDRAGNMKDRCAKSSDLKRAEVAMSPDYSKFLLATIEYDGTAHFIIYDADLINNELDIAENKNNSYVDLRKVQCEDSFTITNFVLNTGGILNSVQGYDLDNQGNIYITSQKSPDIAKKKFYHKEILKIPYYSRTDISEWENINLSHPKIIDIAGKHSEVENIQIINENHGYLTVAYHQWEHKKNLTVLNRIYEIEWD